MMGNDMSPRGNWTWPRNIQEHNPKKNGVCHFDTFLSADQTNEI